MRHAMSHENRTPTNRRPHAALYTILALAFGFVGLAVIVGPGEAFGWVVAYLIPTAVVLGVMVGTLVLLLREGGKAYDRWDKHGRDAFL
jgi:hypothetical protein